MSFPLNRTVITVSKFLFLFRILIFFLLVISHGSITGVGGASNSKLTNIGAIIDVNSRIGKEEKTAMKIAVQNFNHHSKNHKLSLHFQNPGRDPLEAAYAADLLIKQNQAQVIVGIHSWQEAASVANIASQAQVPFLSFAAAAITPQLLPHRWPFLIQMENNGSDQIKCIAEIVRSYNWRRVIAIYEEDAYGGDSGMLALLSQALTNVSSEVEHRVAFPPFSSLSDPKMVVQEELEKVRRVAQSRVFIVLQSSLSMVTYLFKEAKHLGFVGRDSAWIITDTIASFLDTFNTSVISSMEGALGIKTYFPENTTSYKDFKGQFRTIFRAEFQEEDDFQPGIYALRAYDSISTISQAIKRVNNNSHPKNFLESILSSNFTGLSGEIRFATHQLSHSAVYRTLNVFGKKYKDLDFWMPEFGFMKNIEESRERNGIRAKDLAGPVTWPGNSQDRVPKGWAMPTDAEPMLIGVPGETQFEEFVKVDNLTKNPNEEYTGFCIDLFNRIRDLIEKHYSLPYKFVPFYGDYNELVLRVHDKTFDAVVGDVTIVSDRSRLVEFTQPYAESGLSMIFPVKRRDPSWLFSKPFTPAMWMVTGVILIYTTFIIWFLEHQSNPEFKGPWKKQLSTAFWFTLCSLFFAHREKVNSNLTRVVVMVWFFVVFILSSSYTASLSSLLTVEQLEPHFDTSNVSLKVGCDGDSFVREYLQNVLHFKSEDIINVTGKDNYEHEFKSGNISAAFLEVPYRKVFLNKNCKGYTAPKPTYRFGGLGFAFQKGSPIATDFSEAILNLSEKGVLLELEEKWLTPPHRCSANVTSSSNTSLSLENFMVIYLFSGTTSTICFMIFIIRLLKKYQRHQEADEGSVSPGKKSAWNQAVNLAKFIYNGEINSPGRDPTVAQTHDIEQWSSSRWVYVSPSGTTPEHPQVQVSLPAEIEML